MRFVFIWSGLLCLVFLASFPGVGSGVNGHPKELRGLIVKSVQPFWVSLKTAYLWFMDHTNDVQDLIDWTLKCILDEEFDGKQGFTREELRRQHLNMIGNILVIILMSVGSLQMFRSAIKKSFYEELKLRKLKGSKTDFVRTWQKNPKEDLIAGSQSNGGRRTHGRRK